jgi:hypothetical protein
VSFAYAIASFSNSVGVILDEFNFMNSTIAFPTVADAISPAEYPPIPSATIKTEESAERVLWIT